MAKKAKTKGKDGKKQRDRSADDGSAEIARAEKKLAGALAKVEAARLDLVERERELTDLLQQHGRMPRTEPASVPLFDQTQTLPPTDDEAGAHGAESHAPSADDGSRDNAGEQ